MTARGKRPTKRGPAEPPSPDDVPTDIIDVQGRHELARPAPIQAISMKTPGDPAAEAKRAEPTELPHVKLRALSEISRAQTPQNLGNLAPPYDPAEARARSVRDYVIWGCLAVILASAIALVVWFVAR